MKKELNRIICIALCLVLVFSLIGCSNKEDKLSLVENPSLGDSNYQLGDSMGNYTVVDVNGNEYNFSEILKEKKAIVLNFWYINCGPCQMEFPYLQNAYDKYSDDLEVIAINPVDMNENNISKYAKQNELTIPLVMGEEEWASAFNLKGFPTTVIIDRYGSVAFVHMGAVTQEGVFEKTFEIFTADKYEKTTIKNLEDIK